MDKYTLYAKLENTIIKELKMSWQLTDLSDYTEILETDNRHKSNDYKLINTNGIYLLEYINGSIVNRDLTIDNTNKYRQTLRDQVNADSKELIYKGFTYNGVIFKYSDEEQRNWTSMSLAKDFLTYDFEKRALDNSVYVIHNPEELFACYMAGLIHVETHRREGDLIKDQLELASTIEQMDNIINNNERI
jgi:hypothetical protein